jgi:hypothetical protein
MLQLLYSLIRRKKTVPDRESKDILNINTDRTNHVDCTKPVQYECFGPQVFEGLTYAVANEAGMPMSDMLMTDRSFRSVSDLSMWKVLAELTEAEKSTQKKANGQ